MVGASARGKARALILPQRPQTSKTLWKNWNMSVAPRCFWLPCRADQIYFPTLLFFLCILCEMYIRVVYFFCFLRLNMRKTSSLSTSKQTTFIEVKIALRNTVLLGKCGFNYSICFTGRKRKRCWACRILPRRSHQSALGTIKRPEVELGFLLTID